MCSPVFGFIAKLKLKPGSFEKMLDLVKGLEGRPVKGRVFVAMYRSQSDPDEAWAVSGFKDETTYRANANDPQTAAQFEQWQQLLAAPPEWHDGEIVWDKRW
jgi:quinol monooxygenase YgiN